MRILVVSNLYPPHYLGGYELGCKDVVDGLKAKGHQLRVLTSTYGVGGARSEGEVYRWLQADLDREYQFFPRNVPYLLKKEARNQRAFRRVFRAFRPDVVYIWNLQNVSTSVALLAERLGIPVVYFVSDKWWSRWETKAVDQWHGLWTLQFPSPRAVVRFGMRACARALRLLGVSAPAPLAFRRVHFVSDFLLQDARRAGKPAAQGQVIHWGVDTRRFSFQPHAHSPRRLLYAGQVTPYKGFGTLIEAMRLIVKEYGCTSARLKVVGGSVFPDYIEEVQSLVRSYGLGEHVEFAGFSPRASLPEVYREHDILIFPSLLDEALTISTLEAMACGLAVVATATGGNPEVLRHEYNSLIFEKEDAATCAAHVLRLLEDDETFERLRRNGRRTVEEGFSLEVMLDRIEDSLQSAVSGRAA